MAFTLDFRRIHDLDDAATYVGTDTELLKDLLAASENPDAQPITYERHRIPKKRSPGKFRVVWSISSREARSAHITFSRRFSDFAEQYIPGNPSPSAFGYVRGRSIKENAAQHCGHPWLFRCDIHDFFSTIDRASLKQDFLRWGLSDAAAEYFSMFSTIENKLALGLNASPLLANLHCIALDDKLRDLANANGCTYTRYADDITISGEALPSKGDVLTLIESEGFRTSPKKARTTRIGQSHFVTGLSVSDPSGPRLPKPFKSRLRQELHFAQKFGLHGHLTKLGEPYQHGVNRLDGSVRYAAHIEDVFGERIRILWRQILVDEAASTSYAPLPARKTVHASLLIDECTFSFFGRTAIGLICVATEKAQLLRDHANATIAGYQRDPYAPGERAQLDPQNIHLTDTPETFRQSYFSLLPLLPFRAYIAYKLSIDPLDQKTYEELLRSLLARRLMDHDRSILSIHVEGSSVATKGLIESIVTKAYSGLASRNDRRPIQAPEVHIHKKGEEMALLVADAMLWAFQRAVASPEIDEIDLKRFERLRDRYRYIADLSNAREYSRRRPVPIGIRRPRGKPSS